jgi:hypothetical protein
MLPPFAGFWSLAAYHWFLVTCSWLPQTVDTRSSIFDDLKFRASHNVIEYRESSNEYQEEIATRPPPKAPERNLP